MGKNARTLEQSDALSAFSKVIIYIDDAETQYVEAGYDTGRTLKLHCPWATQAMAAQILAGIDGFKYKPYEATGAIINPAAQLGDGITIDDVYSGIYGMDISYGKGFNAHVSAPNDEEIDHEYPYEYIADRTITRSLARHESDLTVQATEIAARVTKTGQNSSKTFGWSLTEEGFILSSQNGVVMEVTDDKVVFNGRIEATEGFIGNKKYNAATEEYYTDGFYITASAIYNGMQSLDDTAHTGIYIGSDGIALGGGKIKMDASTGKLTCKDISITGGSITGGSIGGGATVGGFSSGSVGSGGSSFYDMVKNPTQTNTRQPINASSLRVDGRQFWEQQITLASGVTWRVLAAGTV